MEISKNKNFKGDNMIVRRKNIKKIAYNEMKTIDNIREKNFDYENKPKRNNIKICVIDDEGFPQLDYLKNLQYSNIDIKYNFESISSLEEYDVFLCDIDGIGKGIDPIKQGIAVAEQILINYPLKKVFIYSGKSTEGYGKLPENIKYLSKQLSANELSKILDNECSYLWNPIEGWELIYELLIKNKICSKTIAIIEDRYVESILSNNNLFTEDYKNLLPKIKSVIDMVGICIRIIEIASSMYNG